MSEPEERVGEHLNGALMRLMATHERLHVLGQDIADPYGGAFKISRGLSSRFPARVLSTPISESGMLGVANGLALAGYPVIAELMFGDFIALGFDQLLNFAAKSVTMYGRVVRLPVIVRCPVGGNRGYGPTHSQSPQKHLIGISQLRLCELSPFHDAQSTLKQALADGQPCVFFEDKVLYTRRMLRRPGSGPGLRVTPLPGPGRWVRVAAQSRDADDDSPDVVLIVPGGMSYSALESARELRALHGIRTDILVPAQIYPFEPDPVLSLAERAGLVCVAEEGTAGGTWGAEVAAHLHARLWRKLIAPVELVSSAPSVIPAAMHLERLVLTQPATITAAILRLAGQRDAQPPPPPPPPPPPRSSSEAPAPRGVPGSPPPRPAPRDEHPITIPTLTSNDTDCVLIEWLVPDGELVAAGTPVVTVETSKASHDIEADRDGVLRHARQPGDECGFGEAIGYLGLAAGSAGHAPPSRATPGPATMPGPDLAKVQKSVAATVTRSHLTIPAAFVTADVRIDPAMDFLRRLSAADNADVDLPALLVKAVGALRPGFPGFFGSVRDDGQLVPASQADIGVTIDAGKGLFIPVVSDVERLSLPDVADEMVGLKMNAVTGGFTAAQLAGGTITLSVNLVDGITFVQPLILPPQAAMISVGGPRQEVYLRADGAVASRSVVTMGLAHDHRVINGRAATLFLAALKEVLEHPAQLGSVHPADP